MSTAKERRPTMLGKRLRQARLMAGLTQKQVVAHLAQLGVSLTKAGLSKYERGGSSPGATLLLKLAQVFGVRSDYFLKEPSVHIEWLAFRKFTSLGKRRQERIQAMAAEIVERQVWLQEKLFPQVKITVPRRHPARTLEDAEKAAAMLRKEWKLDNVPLESITKTMEDRGCIVVMCFNNEGDFHGLSGKANDRHLVSVVSGAASEDRRRFSLARELGHLVMDCKGINVKEQESLANRFAAAFIVPPAVARQELGEHRRSLSFQELGILKRKHGLSMQAWMHRALDLDIINEGHFRTLCIQFSAKGWRKEEPVEFVGQESPTRFRQMTLRALAEGIITPEEAEEFCPGCAQEIESPPRKRPTPYLSAAEVMKLPKQDRDRILAKAAIQAEKEYRAGPALKDFDAFGDEEFYNAYD
jgi:Zn-dependent peptidase ImmA (M78 family)/transcriptional regulator with XRE-family HTH domain